MEGMDIVNPIHATKTVWSAAFAREAFLNRIDKSSSQAFVLSGGGSLKGIKHLKA